MRVDTARDLTFKLYATADEMTKYDYYSELLMVYGNKYDDNKDVERGLTKAELLYYKGNYQECYELLIKVIKTVDSELINKVARICKK